MYDIIVVGNGLIGTAATRYLSQSDRTVTLLGAGEPKDWHSHEGVFASHYDQGRITRMLDDDPVWGLLGKEAMAQYATIAEKSGIAFHVPSGGVTVEYELEKSKRIQKLAEKFETPYEIHNGDELKTAYPYFYFPDDVFAYSEFGDAGHINPRKLVQAQHTIALEQGAQHIPETVNRLEINPNSVTVYTREGNEYQAKQVVLATGAFTNFLLENALDWQLRARTILLGEVDAETRKRLQNMPTFIYTYHSELVPDSDLTAIYGTPPIQYSDGKYYIKIGVDEQPPNLLHTFDDVQTWFQQGGSQLEADQLRHILTNMLPDVNFVSFRHKPCVTTYTPTDYPYVGSVHGEQVFVAAGGCGRSAKSSDALGRIIADRVLQKESTLALDSSVFEPRMIGST